MSWNKGANFTGNTFSEAMIAKEEQKRNAVSPGSRDIRDK
jgi:hypothetical protein